MRVVPSPPLEDCRLTRRHWIIAAVLAALAGVYVLLNINWLAPYFMLPVRDIEKHAKGTIKVDSKVDGKADGKQLVAIAAGMTQVVLPSEIARANIVVMGLE